MVKFPEYLRRIDERLNSESVGKHVGQSDVYDSPHVIPDRSRIPGSRGKGKDNPREGKGARWRVEEGLICLMV